VRRYQHRHTSRLTGHLFPKFLSRQAMRYFAITPATLSPTRLISHLQALQKKTAAYLYLRAQPLYTELDQLIAIIRQHEIMPIIPRGLYQDRFTSNCGTHTRSDEQFNALLSPAPAVQTASCHSAPEACTLFDKGADYVFISPVYRPASKPDDRRPLLFADTLRMLARRYGQRIVLLGGMTPRRIEYLRTTLQADFSVAGISMFFTEGTTDE